jgi:ribosomal-protein-alanine N-acetyltransferase
LSAALFVAPAVPGDAAALAALAGECFSRPWSERQFADELALAPPNAVLAVQARVAGAPVSVPVAFCAYRVVIDELHVLDVAVAPSQRRRGLARRLLALALRAGARAGARLALLEVRADNAGALALYAALGFRESGRRRDYYRDPVEDALLLERAGLDLC